MGIYPTTQGDRMSKKQGNNVVLNGKFKLDSMRYIKDGSVSRPVVFFQVYTDEEKCGGHHHVVAYDRLANEVAVTAKAFTDLTESGRVIPDTIGGGLMGVSVQGWLRSNPDSTVVVADSIDFLTYEIVRALAKAMQNNKKMGWAN
jgi:hypothetical protein